MAVIKLFGSFAPNDVLTLLADLNLAEWYSIGIRTCTWKKKNWWILIWWLKGILPNCQIFWLYGNAQSCTCCICIKRGKMKHLIQCTCACVATVEQYLEWQVEERVVWFLPQFTLLDNIYISIVHKLNSNLSSWVQSKLNVYTMDVCRMCCMLGFMLGGKRFFFSF